MRDSAKLLKFNSDRGLTFDAYRSVSIDVYRSLTFDLNRHLIFDISRDLGFGKRGMIFRGFMCPVCKASVAGDALKCEECGVKFQRKAETTKKKTSNQREQDITKRASAKKVPKSKSQTRNKPKSTATAPKKNRDTFRCPVCGIPLYVGTQNCPGCGLMFSNSATVRNDTRIPKSPPKKNRPGGR